MASPSSLTRKRVAPVLSIAHSQNVNVAAHVRRCSRNPATLHKKTTVHLLACSYPIQAVFRWSPSASKTQWSRQTLHITRKRYRVSPVTEHLGSNRLPVFLRSSNTTHNQGKFQLCPSLAGRVLAHNLLQPLVCANKSPLPVGRPAAALGFEPIASNLEMSVKLEVEFREKQNAHVLRRSIVTAWPYPRGMRRHLVSPCDDVGKLVLQILGRRKSLLENLNEIMQCARVSEEAIADHRIAKLIAKINVSEVLARFCCALRFLLPNLLAEIVEAFPYRLQKKPCFFPISFSREIKSFSREIKHRRSRPITLFTKPEAFTVAPNPKRATRRDCKPTPPMILSEGLVVRRMICSARRHAFVSNAFRDA